MQRGFASNGPPALRGTFVLGLCAVAALVGAIPPAYAGSSTLVETAPPAGEAPGALLVENMRVAGSTLRPRISSDGVAAGNSGGCVYNASGSPTGILNVPLQLPAGANVLSYRMYFNDTSASNSTAWLTVYDLYGAIVEEYSVSSTGSTGNSFTDSAQIDHLIDPSVYSYVLNWRPVVAGATMQLCGFRVFYNPPVIFTDGFETGNTSQWSTVLP